MSIKRRGLLLGLGALLTAPAIVRPGLLMPVSSRLLRPMVGFQDIGEFAAVVAGYGRIGLVQVVLRNTEPGGRRWIYEARVDGRVVGRLNPGATWPNRPVT